MSHGHLVAYFMLSDQLKDHPKLPTLQHFFAYPLMREVSLGRLDRVLYP